MPGYISMPGPIELVVILLFLLIPLAVAVAVALLVIKVSKKPPATPAVTCSKCGHPNPATSRFCSRCGQSLQTPTP